MSNIIDSIQVSGTVYQIQGSGGGNPTVELTQEQYDALVSAGTVSPTTYYIITDATPIDVSNYWTSAQTESAITNAVSGKQDTLIAGDNITISGNVISATGGGGGGKAIEAGRGISVTTGTTADTVSFNLPISAGTGTNSLLVGYFNPSSSTWNPIASGNGALASGPHSLASNDNCFAFGYWCQAKGEHSFAQGYMTTVSGKRSHSEGIGTSATSEGSHSEGHNTTASGNYSHSEGDEVRTTNLAEHSQGRYNVSNKANDTWGDSGNTLFSVGDGTANNARHNAFEIRQNGDIYISKDGSDIKLQDNLGGAASSAITSGDTNAVAGGAVYDRFDEVEQVTAAALNALNDKFGGLKLQQITQSAYDALVSGGTVDSSTLYIITNVVS